MKLSSFTEPRFVDLALDGDDKDGIIASLAGLISRSSKLKGRDLFLADVLAREKLVTTGVGHGVAFPHAKSEAVSGVVFAFGRTKAGVDFGALDGEPVRLVFLIGAPKQLEPSRVYLNLMARLSFLMKSDDNRKALLATESVEEVLRLIDSVG
jgi:mannitol/fructose-specific phosphotransferase system IIA component (Ntr-type)